VSSTLLGTAILASFLGGMVALFAPCCISVMLPAYFATSFRRRSALTSMTLLFALGVAAIILPIAFGAAALSRLITGEHGLVFGLGGTLMVLMGVATLAGRKLPMPAIGMRAKGRQGPASVVVLGAFSGIASACCAPVLAGVVGVSAAATSFVTSLVLGMAYVFGMVAPLFLIALLWDRYNWGESRLLSGTAITLRLAGLRYRILLTTLASGLLLMGMGALVIVIAFVGPDMSPSGPLARLSAELQHIAHLIVSWLGRGPVWLVSVAIFAALAAVVWKAVAQTPPSLPDSPVPGDQEEDAGPMDSQNDQWPVIDEPAASAASRS
jgi:cytochrome c-type biogenesis protein